MTVEAMIEEAAKEAFFEKVNRRMWVSGEDYVKWSQLNEDAQYGWRTIARDVLESLGIPLETLAALRDGTWKAAPVEPTAEMFDAWSKQGGGGNLAAQWAAMLAAAPAKPGDGA